MTREALASEWAFTFDKRTADEYAAYPWVEVVPYRAALGGPDNGQ
jgi:hypothetical protein